MTSDDFNDWRRRLGLTVKQAAEALGMTQRTIAYYAAGREIPQYIQLACQALETEFHQMTEPRLWLQMERHLRQKQRPDLIDALRRIRDEALGCSMKDLVP